MIYFLLEKVIRCAQMSVDWLRASKLVTLGYTIKFSLVSVYYQQMKFYLKSVLVNISPIMSMG